MNNIKVVEDFVSLDKSDIPDIQEEFQETEKFNTPNIPATVYKKLPDLLKKVCSKAGASAEKDITLVSSISTLSSCLPNTWGIYDGRKVYANLYSYIIAKPGTGKGMINQVKELAQAIHSMLTGNTDLEMDKESEKPPVEKFQRMLFLPGNSTATGFNELMSKNKDGSMIFETEGITLSEALNSPHGGFGSSILKAFHHESISYFRRKDKEYVYINNPRLSIVLSSTPTQVCQLIPTIEDGLASRFLFYCFDGKPVMKNVFSKSNCNLEQVFKDMGNEVLAYYKRLVDLRHEVVFSLSEKQENAFISIFTAWHKKYQVLHGDDSVAMVRRLGLATFRICMILTSLRNMDSRRIPEAMICKDSDFKIACDIIDTLKEHSICVFEKMIPRKKVAMGEGSLIGTKRAVFDSLPAEFDRKTALACVRGRLPERSLDRMLRSSVFVKTDYGKYRKIEHV